MKFDNPDRMSPGFKQLMRRARPGQHIDYHVGVLGHDRVNDAETDLIARFVLALSEIGVARLYQKRLDDGLMHYFVVLTETLSIRKDQSGTLQDAERLMEIM